MTTHRSPLVLPFDRRNPIEPAAELAWLRANDPIARVTATTGEPAWLVTRYDDARQLLQDRRLGLAVPGMESTEDAPSDSLFQDPPGHTRLRRLVSAGFTLRRVAEMQPRVADLACRLVDQMTTHGPPVDLMSELGRLLPITVIGELLGIPPADQTHFHAWSNELLALTDSESGLADGWAGLQQLITGQIASKRAAPGEDLLSALIAVRDNDAGRLSENELVMMAITLIPAGYLTTAVGTAFAVLLLSEGDNFHRIARQPSLNVTAVEELLRYQAAAGDIARIAKEDIEVSGVHIHANDKILISLTSANRDGRRFTAPDTLDIARAENPHLTFGHGVHHCLGAALARLELRSAVSALAARIPGVRPAVPLDQLTWQRSEMFGDDVLDALPVTW